MDRLGTRNAFQFRPIDRFIDGRGAGARELLRQAGLQRKIRSVGVSQKIARLFGCIYDSSATQESLCLTQSSRWQSLPWMLHLGRLKQIVVAYPALRSSNEPTPRQTSTVRLMQAGCNRSAADIGKSRLSGQTAPQRLPIDLIYHCQFLCHSMRRLPIRRCYEPMIG